MNPRFSFPTGIVAAIALSMAPAGSHAQSLRGSGASVERMYRYALRDGLEFYETSTGVKRAIARGDLVALDGGRDYTLHRVAFPYVLPSTKSFVERFADQYERGCGEELVVTSGVRPESRQPRNSSARSVHPTGMAVDLRKPRGKCLAWLRRTLLDLEGEGVLEATEERRPAHFHVAVFGDEYNRYAARLEKPLNTTVADDEDDATYRVRAGDSLWSIAHQYETSVRDLIARNKLGDTTIIPGQTLVIPPPGGR